MTKRTSRGWLIQFLVSTTIVSGLAVTSHGQPIEVPCRTRLKGHRGQVDGIVPSADGRLLVTTGWEDGTVRIWDVASGTERRRFEQGIVGSTIKIWDDVSATERRLITQEPVDAVERTRGLPHMRKERLERQGHAGDPRTKFLNIRAVLCEYLHNIIMIIFDGDQSSVCPDEILVYDLEGCNHETIFSSGTGRPRPIYLCQYATSYNTGSVAYSVRKTNNGMNYYKIHIYDCVQRREVARLDPEGLDFAHLWFSPDGKMLSTVASSDLSTRLKGVISGRLTVWNARTGEKIGRVQTEGRRVLGSWFSPNDRELAILGGADQNTVYICYLGTYKITHTLNDFQRKPGQHRVPMGWLTYTPDGRFLIGMGGNGTILFWDTKDYREVLWARLYQSGGVCAVFSPDGKKVMSIVTGNKESDVVKVWDTEQFLSLMPKVSDGAN